MGSEHTENHTTTVCLDGSEVKRQRELHGLTQLYISKVVGVTTDTISRWENNRYPTIRRENALNLAEALEVPLEQIIRKPHEDVPVAPVPVPGKPLALVVSAVALLLVAVLAIWNFSLRPQPVVIPVTAWRALPDFAAPLSSIPVQVKLVRLEGAAGFILKETFPAGWALAEADPPASSYDDARGVARWIVKAGDPVSRIAYLIQVVPAVAEQGDAVFQGEIIAGSGDGQVAAPVEGDVRLKVAPVHWADSNGDGRIDDVEMLETSYIVDEMAGVHIDWEELESLWDADGYRWDESRQQFVPYHAERETAPGS